MTRNPLPVAVVVPYDGMGEKGGLRKRKLAAAAGARADFDIAIDEMIGAVLTLLERRPRTGKFAP